jgi:hypothetical protein
MGCFGYICKGCGTSIRGNCFTGGEKCVMIHVRHGEEMGRVEGHYDEYGRVIEQENLENEDLVFRGEGDGINSHHEICKSEFEFEDSHYSAINTKIFNGKKVNARNFIQKAVEYELGKHNYCPMKCNFYDMLADCEEKRTIDTVYKHYKNMKSLKDKKGIDLSRDTLVFNCRLACENHLFNYYRREFQRLKSIKLDKYSGIVAWHSKCYNAATEEQKKDLTPSMSDPDQSWGKVRKMYK